LTTPSGPPDTRLLVVSHSSVVSVNQEVYRELAAREWDPVIVVPSRWKHSYAKTAVRPSPLAGMEHSLHPIPVAFSGLQQRHFYLARCRSLCAHLRPDVAFIEEEAYSLAATQWSHVFINQGIPFGVQCAENLDRDLPLPIKWLRGRVLKNAAYVAARSDTAGRLARSWGARGKIALAPHAVPGWKTIPRTTHRPFTVGYAGRLVESKGLLDLLEAVRLLDSPVELLLIGDGAMRAQLESQPIPGSKVRVIDDLTHSQMAAGYGQMDVLVLPSHSTPTWEEQFGRVIVEALWCGVPVVGSDSGEIPWLIGLTEGGLVFPERDHRALADRLSELRQAPGLRAELADKGRATVERLFSVPAATDALERLLLQTIESGARSCSTFPTLQ
jgi:glycosyltransferase involved in cell wall biosynthesis